ncbi:C4-dicarboxylate TRAP transporter substrate-binding protein (plasmid) [Catenovulum sp. SX2]|uniref:C4-dicarboxylate TRAP transporter substrate-binding protein n=1 Tax=Catenovulum sp. SX2 TaxID=3398614 RepID=UPI003F82DC2F
MNRFVSSVICGLCLFSCVFVSTAAQIEKQLNLVTSLSSHDPMYLGLERFKQLVEQQTNQQIQIRIFVGSQLGNDDDILEQAMLGANVAVLSDGGRLSNYQHQLGVLGAPYLLQDISQLNKLVDSDLFNSWTQQLSQRHKLKILAFNWWQGSRHLLTQEPINTPSDLTGIRMRTVGAPIWIESIKAMGATATPLSWAEVYSGLQQKVIDAAEAQYNAIYGSRLYEVTSHVTKTQHIQLISGLVTSADWFESLDSKQQQIVLTSAKAAGDFATHLVKSNEEQIENKLRAQGLVIKQIDIQPFVDATEQVYTNLGYSQLRKQVYELLADE